MSEEVDPDRLALAKALSTQAGMLFEDVSAEVLLVGHLTADEFAATLAKARDRNARAGVLLEAAAALLES